MDFRQILELVFTTGFVAGLTFLFYCYFNKPGVREWVDGALSKIPVSFLLNLAASKVEDTKGEFDAHDALKLSARLTDFLKATITDPTNVRFQDVEEEIFEFLKTELSRYRDAGVRGVPDIDDQALRTNVRVVFEQVVRVLSEDSA